MSTFRTQQAKTVIRMDILPPDLVGKRRRPAAARGELIEAQFTTVRDRRSAAQPSHNDNRQGARPAPEPKITMLGRLALAGERMLMRLSADLFSAFVALVFVLIFTAAGGFSFLFSGTNASTEPVSLNIANVTMTQQDADGMRVLLINGVIENHTNGSLPMPAVQAELFSGDKLLATTLISPPAAAIAAGRSRGFSAKVPQPGGKLPDLRLSFAQPEL